MPRETRAGEPAITAELVRALLADQHTDLAGLPLGAGVRGWDNTMVRLGEGLAVRLPRHDAGQGLLDHEVTWLPRIARQTGLDLPVPVRTGVPGAGYPFRWAVVPWVAGTTAAHRSAAARDDYAADLAGLLRALHVSAPDEAPRSPVRGVPLAERAEPFDQRWAGVRDRFPAAVARSVDRAWRDALAAGPSSGPPVWLHGDPHPDNTVVTPGASAGESAPSVRSDRSRPVLVDFGDLCAGDPASDLGIALTHFSPAGAAVFRARYDSLGSSLRSSLGATPDPAPTTGTETVPDEDIWRRARGWALTVAVLLAAQPPQDVLHGVGMGFLQRFPALRLSPAAGSAG